MDRILSSILIYVNLPYEQKLEFIKNNPKMALEIIDYLVNVTKER